MIGGDSVTLVQLLTGANSFLIVLAGYLLGNAWREIHKRVDRLEQSASQFRERTNGRMSAMETSLYGGPRRRENDAD